MEYYFQTKKLSVGYQNKPLIENITIGLKKGEILTLIGPNGAGKSTILKSISKQLTLLAGTVCLDGKDINRFSENDLAKKMSVLLTDKLRTEMMTCEEVVETGRYPYTGKFGVLSPVDHRIVQQAMDMVHISDLRELDFTHISDGQKQRTMLARCLCQEPEIIILDEPTSFLDIKYKLEFLSILQRLCKKSGITVIMSMHELELAEKISDKILCVKGAYVDRFGTAEEIFQTGYLSDLFSINEGSFDEETASMELDAVKGLAKTFVIAGGGTGRSVYRRLQREGIPFVTGILFQNDVDYPVARALATKVVVADAFEPISDTKVREAKKMVDSCERIIYCKNHFGTYEKANLELLDYAETCKKEIVRWQK